MLKRHAAILLLLCLVMSLSGCGLVAVPSRTELPPAQMQRVRVCDAVTQQPILHATVCCELERWVNWMPASAMPARVGPSPHVVPFVCKPAVLLEAKEMEAGVHVIEPVRRWQWAHVWFPLGFPLGGVLYRGYEPILEVDAPGYVGVQIRGTPRAEDSSWPGEGLLPYRVCDDALEVYLPRADGGVDHHAVP